MCGPLHDTITWGCALCFLPEILLKYYGSTHVIRKAYPAAVRYMEYMKTKEREGGLIEHGLGDWGRDIAWGNLQSNIETAVYYKCLQCTEMMARELGLSDEANRYKEWAARVYKVYNKHLLVTGDSAYDYAYYTSRDDFPQRDRQAVAQALALQFGMVPEAHISDVRKAFLDDVSDCKIRSGEIGLRYLFNTLNDLQRPDILLAMARQEEHPSYMRFIRKGETTFLEFWQDECRSKSHDLFCTIHEWFYSAVLGVKPVGNAYKTFTITPPYDSEFNKVEGTVDCPYGEISVQFAREKHGAVKLALAVPVGTVATLNLPGQASKVEIVRAGGQKRGATGRSVELLPGSYSVTISS